MDFLVVIRKSNRLIVRNVKISIRTFSDKQFVYLNLLTSGRLNEYLASVDEQAEDMFSRLVKEYADKQGVTEQLKAENQLEWVGKMNNIRSRAVEIIDYRCRIDLCLGGQSGRYNVKSSCVRTHIAL